MSAPHTKRPRTTRLAILAAIGATLVPGLTDANATPLTRAFTVEVWDATETTRLATYTQDVATESFHRFAVAAGGWNDPGSSQGQVAIDDLTVGFADGTQTTNSFTTAPTIIESTTGNTNDAVDYDAAGQRLLGVADSGYSCSTNYESVDVGNTAEITSARFTFNRLTGDTGDGSYWDLWAGLTPGDGEPILGATCTVPDPTGYVDNLVGVRITGDGDGVRRGVSGFADGTQAPSEYTYGLYTTYVVKMTVVASNLPPSAMLISPASGDHLPYLGYEGQQHFTFSGYEPEGSTWSGTVYARRTNQPARVQTWPVPTQAANGPVTISAGRLDPGLWEWSVSLSDAQGATAQSAWVGFTVDPLAFADGVYVALGDSFASGEGVGSYESGTDVGTNKCHRSSGAYPRLVSMDTGMPARVVFGACSGAQTVNLYNPTQYGVSGTQWDEPTQFSRLTDDTTLVTMSIGGNDAGFGTVLNGCLFTSPCANYSDLVARRFARLNADRGATLTASDISVDSGLEAVEPLATVFYRLRQAAPHARVLILGYPRFFTVGGGSYCGGSSHDDQVWMNTKVAQLDDIVETRAKEAGFEYVDVENALDGHEMCTTDQWINGVNPFEMETTYHPNQGGHNAEAAILRTAIASPPPQEPVCQNCSTTVTRTVPSAAVKMTATSRWPGGDVAIRLRSPSGRTIDRTTSSWDVQRVTNPDSETVTVLNPEAGNWFVDLLGNDVLSTDDVRLDFTTQASINTLPQASFTYSYDGVSTISVNGSGSTDSDGSVVEWQFDYGDGMTGYGAPSLTHVAPPGTYTITLQARDDAGGTSYAYSNPITVWGYTWSGFLSGTASPPTFNRAIAGRSVKLKYKIWRHDGLNVNDPSSFSYVASKQVNCDGTPLPGIQVYTISGDPVPTWSNGTWTYTWNPSSSWAGTCRQFELNLYDKGPGRYALFDFR